MEVLGTWVINLDRARDRLQRIAARLDALGLPWKRLQAVDARSLTPAQHAALDVAGYRRKHGKEPLLAELGCYLSHWEVMRAFLASEARFALVFEDDSRIGDSLPAVLQGLIAHPETWDVVKLSGVHSGTPIAVGEVAPGHRLAVMLTRCTGASAYLVNRRAAQAFADGLLPMSLPYDHICDQGWRFGLKVRIVTPTPCVHDDRTESTIAAPPARERNFHWSRRLPTFRYRIGNECRRLAYGVGELLRSKMS